MQPAALLSGLRPSLVRCRPQTVGAVGDQQLGSAQSALGEVGEEFIPRRCAFSHRFLERDEMLVALAISAQNRQERAPLVIRAGAEIDAIGPGEEQIELLQPARLPGFEVSQQLLVGPRDRRGRQWGVGTEKGAQRALEIAGRQAIEPQIAEALIDVWQTALVPRQDG